MSGMGGHKHDEEGHGHDHHHDHDPSFQRLHENFNGSLTKYS